MTFTLIVLKVIFSFLEGIQRRAENYWYGLGLVTCLLPLRILEG